MLSPLFDLSHQFIDRNGTLAVGGYLYVYEGSTDKKARTYADANGAAENQEKIVLDSNGRANVWVDPSKHYTLHVHDSKGQLLYTIYPMIPSVAYTGGNGVTVKPDGSTTIDIDFLARIDALEAGLRDESKDRTEADQGLAGRIDGVEKDLDDSVADLEKQIAASAVTLKSTDDSVRVRTSKTEHGKVYDLQVAKAMPNASVTSQDRSVKVTERISGNHITWDLSATAGADVEGGYEYGAFYSLYGRYGRGPWVLMQGNMERTEAGDHIKVTPHSLYAVSVEYDILVTNTVDAEHRIRIKTVDDSPVWEQMIDCSNPGIQKVHAYYLFDSMDNAEFAPILPTMEQNEDQVDISVGDITVQLHRVVTMDGADGYATWDSLNRVYYGAGTDAITYSEAAGPGKDAAVMVVQNGLAPRRLSIHQLQEADIVVTESEYEQMEQEGLVDPDKRYVIVED